MTTRLIIDGLAESRELEVTLQMPCAPNLFMDQAVRFGLMKVLRENYTNLLKGNELIMERDPCNVNFNLIKFAFVTVDPKVDLQKMLETCITLIEGNTGKKVEIIGLQAFAVTPTSTTDAPPDT